MRYSRILERFVAFRRIPLRIVGVTALASYAMQAGAVLQGQPLYIIALYTLIPWIPLAFFEGLWKVKHYHWVAVFAVVTALQVGHLGEHAFQVTQLRFLDGQIACPPPVDSPANARLAVERGLRPSGDDATGRAASTIGIPNAQGEATQQSGKNVTGPPACGVFGQLDFETVHLVWDTAVWLGALVLLLKFPGNIWLWIAMGAASIHEIEHLFLGWIFFQDNAEAYAYMKQLWATTVEGNTVTAHPAGKTAALTTFYEAGGKTGLMGKNGLVENVFFGGGASFPLRPYLHFGYNTLVVVPTVLAFLVQVRRVYDEYLAQALPDLTEEQLIRTTPKLETLRFAAGEDAVRQGEYADRFFIITRGHADVLRTGPDGREVVVNRISPGQYFGEIGLLHGGRRIATVRAVETLEVLALDRAAFAELMSESEMSRQEMDRVVRHRVLQVKATR